MIITDIADDVSRYHNNLPIPFWLVKVSNVSEKPHALDSVVLTQPDGQDALACGPRATLLAARQLAATETVRVA